LVDAARARNCLAWPVDRRKNNMASYFVASRTHPDGGHAVHDRSRCPPGCFPAGGTGEYLGEFNEAAQALAVARVRYAWAHSCTCCAEVQAPPAVASEPAPALFPVRT
jgi:hypothetical protein